MFGKLAPFPFNLMFHQYRIRVMIATTTPLVSKSPKSSPSYRQVVTKSSPQSRPQTPPMPLQHHDLRSPLTHSPKPAALSSCTVHHPRSTAALCTHSNSSRPPTREAFTSKLEWALEWGGEGFLRRGEGGENGGRRFHYQRNEEEEDGRRRGKRKTREGNYSLKCTSLDLNGILTRNVTPYLAFLFQAVRKKAQ